VKLSYDGYLSPYLEIIAVLHRQGADRKKIAGELYSRGVRSPHFRSYWSDEDHKTAMAAMVGYILRPTQTKRAKAKWQVWTAEDQARELEAEYQRWS
jgi:hypothetical protein